MVWAAFPLSVSVPEMDRMSQGEGRCPSRAFRMNACRYAKRRVYIDKNPPGERPGCFLTPVREQSSFAAWGGNEPCRVQDERRCEP